MTGKQKKNPPHRPPFEPTPEQRALVEQLATVGIPQEIVAKIIGVAEKTLRKHFGDELELGGYKANAKVAYGLYQKALDGDTASMIFWLKTRARWKESPATLEHTGPDGKPLAVPSLGDFYATVRIAGDGDESGGR